MIVGSINLLLAFATCAYNKTFPPGIGLLISFPLLLIAYMSYRASFAALLVMLTSLLLLLCMSYAFSPSSSSSTLSSLL